MLFEKNIQFRALLRLMLFALLGLTACRETTKNPAATEEVTPEMQKVLDLTAQLVKDPANDSLLYLRAAAYHESEGYDEAIADLQRAIGFDSLQPMYYHLLADCFLDYYRSYPAIQTMERAVTLFPDRIPTLLKMSEFYLIVQKHSDALKAIDKVFQRDPQNAEGFFMTGMIAQDMGDTTRAIKSFERSVAINPDNYDAWINMGNLLLAKKSPICAQYYKNAIRVDPSNPIGHDCLATYYHKNGDFDLAKESYLTLRNLDETRAETYYDLGLLYMNMENFEQSKTYFDTTLLKDPLYFRALYYRGIVFEALGDTASAKADYRKSLSMVSDLEESKEALKRLE